MIHDSGPLFLFLICLLFHTSVQAGTIRMRLIYQEQNVEIQYVGVSIKKASHTGEEHFGFTRVDRFGIIYVDSLPDGTYSLRLSYVDCMDLKIQHIQLGDSEHMDLGTITIPPMKTDAWVMYGKKVKRKGEWVEKLRCRHERITKRDKKKTLRLFQKLNPQFREGSHFHVHWEKRSDSTMMIDRKYDAS